MERHFLGQTKLIMISVKNLTKKFGDLTAVGDVSFEVPRGDIFAFLGPNGAGKTTTIKMLTTLLKPTKGVIRLNGFDPQSDQDAVRRSFGIVFQDQSLDDELTAYENMHFHAVLFGVAVAERAGRIAEMLRFVELWDRRNDFVKQFSGGMKRRLEIARGLLHHPKIIFFDEPTLGLDPQTRNHIWNYVLQMNKTEGTTIFFTTHYMEEVERFAKNAAIIDHGKIIARGTPSELKAQAGAATLEDAFIALTGRNLRTEEAGVADGMRLHRKLWHR